MYLSWLLIDTGDNPDRPRPGRRWLNNLYRVHQRLCMAFPSPERVAADAEFLKPYRPEDFRAQVHISRDAEHGFLFRVEALPGGRAAILVQSSVRPDWRYAFQNAGYLLAAPPEIKPFTVTFEEGQRWCFRLLANPTRKIDTKSGPEGQRNNGRRVPVPPNQFLAWLVRKGEHAGFTVETDSLRITPGFIYVNPHRNGDGKRLRSVRYDGVLEVVDPDRFQAALLSGLGSAKGFGFGLLSVARA